MNLKDWLDAERGRYTELSRLLEVSVSRISQMADHGVPTKYMLTVQEFTGGEVTLQDMVQARTPDPSEKAGA